MNQATRRPEGCFLDSTSAGEVSGVAQQGLRKTLWCARALALFTVANARVIVCGERCWSRAQKKVMSHEESEP